MKSSTPKPASVKPGSKQTNSLDQLLAELDQKLTQRLEEIEQDRRSREHAIEQEQQRLAAAEMLKLEQAHTNQMLQLRTQAQQKAAQSRQQQLWKCQQQCVEQVLSDTRRLLSQQRPDPDYLKVWLKQALRRLGDPTNVQLCVNPQWAALLSNQLPAYLPSELQGVLTGKTPEAPRKLSIATAALLGGAILRDTNRHIEVDGSWDQRLKSLIPDLWQRWLQSVGTNNAD
jgi:vacuolar-type H+-ATPase subunit E/Vma4